MRQHHLAPDPEWLGPELVKLLKREGLCDDPIWISWFDSTEVNGKDYGEVFDLD